MINTGRGVLLDTITEKDNDILRDWRNEYRIWKWCRQNSLINEIKQQAWYEMQGESSEHLMLLVRNEKKDAIGVCGLTSIDRVNQRAEFSLYIAGPHMGVGYGSKALSTLLDHGFGQQNLNHIFGETFDGNSAADIFERLGFKKEGTRREFYYRDGRFIDAHLYSMLRSEWKLQLPQF